MFQRKTRPQASYLFPNSEIGAERRFHLVNLLFENQDVLQLCHDTIFLAIRLVDRYSSKKAVPQGSLYFYYGVCLLISSKYIERRENIPKLDKKDWVLYGVKDWDVESVERDILETLEYTVGRPLLTEFAWMELPKQERTKQTMDMVLYLCKLTLFDPGFVPVPSNVVARSIVAAARLALRMPPKPILTDEAHYELVWQVLFRLFRGLEGLPRTLFDEYKRPENSFVAVILNHRLSNFNTL